MSGQARAVRVYDRFRLEFESQIRVSVATITHPDGTTSGPKDYFEDEERELAGEIEQIAPAIGLVLGEAQFSQGVLIEPFDAKAQALGPKANKKGNHTITISGEGLDARLEVTLGAYPSDEQLAWLEDEFKTTLRALSAWASI